MATLRLKVTAIRASVPFKLAVTFSDGTHGAFNAAPMLAERGEGTEPLRDRAAAAGASPAADRDEAYELALLLAEQDAALGDYRSALHALDAAAGAILRHASTGDGGTCLRAEVLLREPFEIALRVLAGALAPYRDSAPHLRLQRLEATLEKVRAAHRNGRALTLTLAGVVIRLSRTG